VGLCAWSGGRARSQQQLHAHTHHSPLPRSTPATPPAAGALRAPGELAEYVRSELNVAELAVCADVLAYAELAAEPEWGTLGKRLGKDMGKVCCAGGAVCVGVCVWGGDVAGVLGWVGGWVAGGEGVCVCVGGGGCGTVIRWRAGGGAQTT
jgi:hypothetical protein